MALGRDSLRPANARRVEFAGRQFSLGMLSALVLGTMILGVLAYIVMVRPAHDGTTAANCLAPACAGALVLGACLKLRLLSSCTLAHSPVTPPETSASRRVELWAPATTAVLVVATVLCCLNDEWRCAGERLCCHEAYQEPKIDCVYNGWSPEGQIISSTNCGYHRVHP